jgi:hypothetical protein
VDESYPEPFDYFASRGISIEGSKLAQENSNSGENKYHKRLAISVTLPEGFPNKYKKALLAGVNTCAVKVIQVMPELDTHIAVSYALVIWGARHSTSFNNIALDILFLSLQSV